MKESACSIALSGHDGMDALDEEIRKLQSELGDVRDPVPYLERLGWLFVAKARRSFDPGYYRLAEATAHCMNVYRPAGLEALLLTGHVLHQVHRFEEAEDVARKLVRERGRHFDYGLLGDVLMEQGELDEAAEAYQAMMDQRPSPQAYSRAAHLRWLTGDVDGAIQLMRMAVGGVGGRDTESAAWSYARLASYELQAKDFDGAAAHVDAALALQADYPPALLVAGKLELESGNMDEAVRALTRAAAANPLPEYQWLLADVLRSAGRDDDAAHVESELMRTGSVEDPRTMALFLATTGRDAETAWRLAHEELDARRDVFTLDAVAWTLFARGRAGEARAYVDEALAQGTRDGRLYFHAAAIETAVGDRAAARRHLELARELEHTLYPREREALDSLGTD